MLFQKTIQLYLHFFLWLYIKMHSLSWNYWKIRGSAIQAQSPSTPYSCQKAEISRWGLTSKMDVSYFFNIYVKILWVLSSFLTLTWKISNVWFHDQKFSRICCFSPFFIFYFAKQFFSSSIYPKLNQEMKGAIKKKMMVSAERNTTEVHKSAEELWRKWLQHECKKNNHLYSDHCANKSTRHKWCNKHQQKYIKRKETWLQAVINLCMFTLQQSTRFLQSYKKG